MQRSRFSVKFLALLVAGLIVLYAALTLYDEGGQKFLRGSTGTGRVPLSGYEALFLFAVILAPIGCILTLAGLVGLIEKLFPRGED